MTANEARQKVIAHMVARYGFTSEMCKDKSADNLLHIAAMMVGHRRYLGVLEADEVIQLGEMEKIVAEVKQLN
jgi:hypothetical protein